MLLNLLFWLVGSSTIFRLPKTDPVIFLYLMFQLSFKDNQLTGSIPDWIASLEYLQLLDLDSNDLTGTIPSSIANMKGLDHLLLNRNRLSGTVPSFLAKMTDLGKWPSLI